MLEYVLGWIAIIVLAVYVGLLLYYVYAIVIYGCMYVRNIVNILY